MNLTLQDEKPRIFAHAVSGGSSCQVALCAILLSLAGMVAAVGRREALEALIRHGFLRFTCRQYEVHVLLAVIAF